MFIDSEYDAQESAFRPWNKETERSNKDILMIKNESEINEKYDQSLGSMISVGLGLGIKLPKHMVENKIKSPTQKANKEL